MNMQMIGGLMVQLAADVANLKKDMTEAEKVVDKGAVAMSKGLDFLKGAFIGLAGALSVGAIVAWVKAAADAGDEMKAFSQKTGVAVEDVAGLQLAFKQGGVESQALQSSIARMSKQMAEGNKIFKEMGVETRNTDGSLRSAKDVLYDVADATKEMGSSLNTTAALQEIFGKGAGALLPTLLEGSEGLKKMDEMARKLGLTMSAETADAADSFNDTVELLGLGLTGVGRQIAGQMLPTLSNLAASFLESMTEGDRLKRIADGLGVVFKLLYTAVVGVIEVFSTFGKLIGGTIARLMAEISGLGTAIVKVFQGDFKGAAEAAQDGFKQSAQISREMSKDIKDGWQSTGKAIVKAWDDTADKNVAAMAAMGKSAKTVTMLTKEQEEAAKKAAAEEKKRTDEVKKLTAGLDKQIATQIQQEGQEKALTAAQKQALEIMLKIQDGTLKLTDAEKREVVAKLAQIDAGEKHQEELAKEKKWLEETGKENDKYRESVEKSTASINDEVKKLKEANQMIGLSKEATVGLEMAKLEEQATAKDRLATWAEENMLGEDLVNQYREQAKGLRELAQLKGEKVHLEAAVEARDAWAKTTEEIGKGLTDSLFRAFESGKDFFSTFWDGVKNLFKTTVLKMLIQPVQSGMNSWLGSVGGGSNGSGGGSFSGFTDLLGNGLSAFGNWMGEGSTIGGWANTAGSWLKSGSGGAGGASMFGAFGSAFSGGGALANAGLGGMAMEGGWTAMMNGNASMGLGQMAGAAGSMLGGFMAGRGVGQAISGGYSAFGGQSGNSAVNTGAAIGAAVGSIIPGLGTMIGGLIGGALGGLANRAFGHKAKEYNGDKGLEGVLGGSTGLVNGNSWAEWTQKGGWFRSDKHGTDTLALDDETSKALRDGAMAVYKETEDFAKALGLPAEALKNVTTTFRVKVTDSQEENTKALTEAFAQYATDLTNSFADAVAPFKKAGETVQETLSRLVAIKQFSEALNQFGGVFSRIAGLSISAKEQLVEFAGGIEAFVAKTQQFVADYYTEQEKLGLTAKQIQDAFKSIGVDSTGLSSKADFRALVESQDLNTEAGRKVFSQLLDLAPMFAQVGDYLSQNAQTLDQLAASAPQQAILDNILKDQEATSRYQARQEELQQQQIDATRQGYSMLNDSLHTMFAKLDSIGMGIDNWGQSISRIGVENLYLNGANP